MKVFTLAFQHTYRVINHVKLMFILNYVFKLLFSFIYIPEVPLYWNREQVLHFFDVPLDMLL